MKSSPLATIILAAGKGTRMKSDTAKVLHEVFFEPMVHHVIRAVTPLSADRMLVIIGHQKERVMAALDGFDLRFVEQTEQNGTGHAVLCAEEQLADFQGNVLIVCGDSPLLKSEHLQEMLSIHSAEDRVLTIVTTSLENPSNYGRIISDTSGSVVEIVEEKDASESQRTIKEVNAGIYCVKKDFLFDALKNVTTDNSQKEMYLTDIVAIAVNSGLQVKKYEHPFPEHVLGVNSRVELAKAHQEIQSRRNSELMAMGITMYNPESITVTPSAALSPGCTLTQHITISGVSAIGAGSLIEPGVTILNSRIGENVTIGSNSVITNCSIGDSTSIEPLSRLKDTSQ